MAAERVYWVDRCLGTNIVPGTLRAQSIQVRTYVELYPNDSEVPDYVWIPEVTARGWIILTKDKRIRYSPVEIGAIQKANARYVCLSAGNLRGDEQANVPVFGGAHFVWVKAGICQQGRSSSSRASVGR